jgi:hypothetical protein
MKNYKETLDRIEEIIQSNETDQNKTVQLGTLVYDAFWQGRNDGIVSSFTKIEKIMHEEIAMGVEE